RRPDHDADSRHINRRQPPRGPARRPVRRLRRRLRRGRRRPRTRVRRTPPRARRVNGGTTMTGTPRRRFHDIRCDASRLGDWMNHLEDRAREAGLFDGAFIPEDPKYHIEGRGDRLLGIYHALTIIAERANGRINPEALEAFRLEVEA